MLPRTQIEAAKPQEKPFKLFDGRGLYLEVAPAGGWWWRFKYRHGGKEKRVSLGVYPDVGLKETRERLDEARKVLAAGIDPAEQRKAAKLASAIANPGNSFEIVGREWFKLNEPKWARSHAEKIIGRLERDVFENTVNAGLRRMGYTNDEMTGHGFRSMASTLLNEQRWHPDAIERQLAHDEENETRGAYNYAEHLPERRRMMQSWADCLNGLARNRKAGPVDSAGAASSENL
jgi:integrase